MASLGSDLSARCCSFQARISFDWNAFVRTAVTYQSFDLARNCSAFRLGMKRYAPALTVTNRGSAEVRSRSGRAGIVMWLDGSSFRLLSPVIGSLLSLSPPTRGLLHHVCCTNSNWLRMLALTQKK